MMSWYVTPWEFEAERRGPLEETVFPGHHWCEAPQATNWPDCPLQWGEEARCWGLVSRVGIGKGRIVDMGGHIDGRAFPNATNWDKRLGHDMRDVNEIAGDRFDLIISSHSIEHIPSGDVPKMLDDWIPLLEDGGDLFVSGPHRCSKEWSPIYTRQWGDEDQDGHCWAPTASCVGNLLIEKGLRLVAFCDHWCAMNSWWVWLTKC